MLGPAVAFYFLYSVTVAAGDRFLIAGSEQRFTDAHVILIESLRQTRLPSDLATLFFRSDLVAPLDTDWSPVGFQMLEGTLVVALQASISNANGALSRWHFILELEGGEWRIGQLTRESQPPVRTIPPKAEIEVLVRDTMDLLNRGMATNNYQEFHQQISESWRLANTNPVTLSDSFEHLRQSQVEFAHIISNEPMLLARPQLEQEMLLVVRGSFGKSDRLRFQQKFIWEKDRWWRSVASFAAFAPVAEREEWPTAPLCWWTKSCRISRCAQFAHPLPYAVPGWCLHRQHPWIPCAVSLGQGANQ